MMNLNRLTSTSNIPPITNAYTLRVPSPDGEIFVHCDEDGDGKLIRVLINIGKAGSAVTSWADGLARVITLSLRFYDLTTILEELSENRSDRFVFSTTRVKIRSGVDAVFHALLMYRNLKSAAIRTEYAPPMMTIPENW